MQTLRTLLLTLTATSTLVLAACEQLPGTREEQTTTGIGGAAGAAVGAAVSDNDLVGALLGGAAGAAGGYLVGARTDWFDRDRSDVSDALEEARETEVSVSDVYQSNSADINNDGFVTSDELLTMEEAGLTDEEILDRLEATGQVFDLSDQQQERFVNAGLSPYVVNQMENINRDERDRLFSEREVLGRNPA